MTPLSTQRRLPAWLAGLNALATGLLVMTLPSSAAPAEHSSAQRSERARLLAQVRRWGCQYQSIKLSRIAASDLDMIVIDHTPNGRRIGPQDLAPIRRKPDGKRRLVLGYLSVGEAESYRPYWKSEWLGAPPAWLGPENINWKGSFAVRYWEPQWRGFLYGSPEAMLDKILSAGFDGVFLDRVDAYGDWAASRPGNRAEMVSLVADIAAYARTRNPHFLVIGQNAEPLLSYPEYRLAIDAVSKESLLFGLKVAGQPNSPSDVQWSLSHLQQARRAGLRIFTIEYLSNDEDIAEARATHEQLGHVPFFAERLLDKLPGDRH